MASNRSTRQESTIEILQHWRSAGQTPLEGVYESFRRKNPNVRFNNRAVEVSKLRLTVKSEILKENHPHLWIEWPGKNLEPTVKSGVIADITDIWEENGLVEKFVSGAREAAKFNGRYRCIPSDLYHINNLFYNIGYVEESNIEIDEIKTPEDFVVSLEEIDHSLDVSPIVINGKDAFGILQLWETLILAYGGQEVYEDLISGNARIHRETIVRTLETLDQILEYTPADTGFISSGGANSRFTEHDAVFIHDGGWALGHFGQVDDFEYGSEWGYTPFPGTSDIYQMNMNAVVPGKERYSEVVEEFLSHLSSPKSLEHIANHLGAVPPIRDVDPGSLHQVIRQHYRDLQQTDYHAPSVTHGLGVKPETLIEMKASVGPFVREREIEKTVRGVIEALDKDTF